MSRRRRAPFERQLARALRAGEFLDGLPMAADEARGLFIGGGACWLWEMFPAHVRTLPPASQVALIEDARASSTPVASEMLAALFPARPGGPA